MRKVLLNTLELIEHCKDKGIKFELISEKDASNYLDNNAYFFKLASYRFNYDKHKSGINVGKYINLDFAFLVDLFEIDNDMKTIILNMCLKIEQALKTEIIKFAEGIPGEDGHNIMRRYELYANSQGFDIYRSINNITSSAYTKCLVDKYSSDFPIWVYLELITFGDLINFCNFYHDQCGFSFEKDLYHSIRNIRNACAHNNCLINDLMRKSYIPNNKVKKIIYDLNIFSKDVVDKKMKNQFIHGLVCLLVAYNKLITPNLSNDDILLSLREFFLNRAVKHREWYVNNNILVTSYDFIIKLINHYCEDYQK